MESASQIDDCTVDGRTWNHVVLVNQAISQRMNLWLDPDSGKPDTEKLRPCCVWQYNHPKESRWNTGNNINLDHYTEWKRKDLWASLYIYRQTVVYIKKIADEPKMLEWIKASDSGWIPVQIGGIAKIMSEMLAEEVQLHNEDHPDRQVSSVFMSELTDTSWYRSVPNSDWKHRFGRVTSKPSLFTQIFQTCFIADNPE